jgi:hypothetical protein
MKYKNAWLLVPMMLAVGFVSAEEGQAENPLIAAQAERGVTPEGALTLWFDAVYLYMDEDTRDQGREALTYLTIPFKDEPGWEKLTSNRIFVSRMQDPAYAHIFRSYAVGTNPENAYSMDPQDYELDIVESSEDTHGRGWRVLIRSSGADSPRPVYMKKSTTTGLWYVSEFGNVYVGIRAPQEEGEERFE